MSGDNAVILKLIDEGFAARDRAISDLRQDVATVRESVAAVEARVDEVKATVQRVESDVQAFSQFVTEMRAIVKSFQDFQDALQDIQRAARFVCSKKTWGYVGVAVIAINWIVDNFDRLHWPF